MRQFELARLLLAPLLLASAGELRAQPPTAASGAAAASMGASAGLTPAGQPATATVSFTASGSGSGSGSGPAAAQVTAPASTSPPPPTATPSAAAAQGTAAGSAQAVSFNAGTSPTSTATRPATPGAASGQATAIQAASTQPAANPPAASPQSSPSGSQDSGVTTVSFGSAVATSGGGSPVSGPSAAPVQGAAPAQGAAAAQIAAPSASPKSAQTGSLIPSSSPPSSPSPAMGAGSPSCSRLDNVVDPVASTGKVKVPTTTDSSSPGKDPDALRAINREFKVDDVEKHLFDPLVDLASQARLLVEYRCFGNWRRQHDFYRKVATESACPYLRHRAIEMLEFDVCTTATVDVYLKEYARSPFPETRELILRKLGASRDQRAVELVREGMKSKIRSIARAALEGKEFGDGQPCVPQAIGARPYYSLPEVGDVCDLSEEQRQARPQPASNMLEEFQKSKLPKAGGADSVNFGK